MIGKTISHYKITEKLGAGGMGVVYKAEDLSLKRSIALKFLPEEYFDDEEAKVRFSREARAASALTHPNICVIHELGEHDNQPFIAMECLEGQTLQQRMEERRLATDEILELGSEIADGLEAAHSKGIVHRDIKPANIFITDRGRAKILDFGLAKIHANEESGDLEPDAPTKTSMGLTRPGVAMGTVSYMSPEQALGSPIDHRTDLFSLGIVLYEMVMGAVPFVGKTAFEVCNEILHKKPSFPREQNPELPEGLCKVISRCLEKDPDLRYPSANELLIDLKSLAKDPTGPLSQGPIQQTPAFQSSGSIAPEEGLKSRRTWVVLPVLLVCAAAVFYLVSSRSDNQTAEEKRIAVLPFENLSTEEENAFFAQGVHEDVMTKLAGLKDLKVISRTTVMSVEGSAREIGERLDARYIVEGSVRRSEDQVRVTAQLIDTTTDESLWSANYDRELVSVFAVQSAIAEEIAATLRAKISPSERAQLGKVPTQVVEAYDHYLKARGILNASWFNWPQLQAALEHARKATEADPNFAEAWGLLSRAWSEQYDTLNGMDDRESELAEAAEEAEAALAKARQLAPDQQETLKAEGYFSYMVKKDLVGAMRSLDRALEIVPNDSETLFYQSQVYLKLNQLDKVVEGLERGYALDTANGKLIYGLTFAYELSHNYAKMVPFFERLLEIEPEKTHYGVQAKYYQFLADGSLESFHAFEEAVRAVRETEQCDVRNVQNRRMVVALMNDEFDAYVTDWAGKWDRHHRGHGEWACPLQINDEANHAHLLLDRGSDELAAEIITRAQNSTTRPYTEMSICIFDKAAFKPKLDYMSGDPELARREFDDAVMTVMANDTFPRGTVEKSVLLETADMVAPDRVYSIYREVTADPISMISMEKICTTPWTYPNLLRDPRFVEEIRTDGRFVEFLEHYGLLLDSSRARVATGDPSLVTTDCCRLATPLSPGRLEQEFGYEFSGECTSDHLDPPPTPRRLHRRGILHTPRSY